MATLVYSDAGNASARFQLLGSPILIGASDECAVRSPSPLNAPRHARLFEKNGEFWIEDLGGPGGVFVGDKRVAQSRVPFGEVIVVGSLLLRIDDGNGEPGEPIDATEILRLLAASAERQRQLEEERDALGSRLGELHQELAAARNAVAEERIEPTLPLGGFDPVGLERLAAELQTAEESRRDIEAKINKAERRRARTKSEVDAAEVEEGVDDSSEMEIRQVQLLALNAQLAEVDKSVERLRGQLKTRNQEIAKLRAKARMQTGSDIDLPKTTQPYSVPQFEEENEAHKQLKVRFEAEFERAVTLQRKLKTAETRLAEAEKAATKIPALEAELTAAKAQPVADPAETSALARQVDDLKVLLEGSQREANALRGKHTAAKEEAVKAATRAQALESELTESAAKVIEQAEGLVSLGARLEDAKGALAARDHELTEMAAAVAISAESSELRERLEQKVTTLENDLANIRGALKRAEESRDAALGAKRELEARAIAAKSETGEVQAKLAHADRRLVEAQNAREAAEESAAAAQRDVVRAREARLAAEEALAAKSPAPGQDNTAIVSLKRRISENQEESSKEVERLEARLREVETDLDRALDAEQAALARADAEAAAVSAQIERLTEEKSRLAADREKVGAELESKSGEIAALKEALAGAKQSLAADPDADARSKVIELASQNAQLSSQLSVLAEEKSEASARIATLEHELAAAESALRETTGAREQLAAANSDLTRRYEAVSEKLTTARGQTSDHSAPGAEFEAVLRECQQLRERVAELEAGIEAGLVGDTTSTSPRVDTLSDTDEFTTTGPGTELIEWMNNLHESISKLRRQMRAASDEAAVSDGSASSLEIVNNALSSSVECVEAARESLAKIAGLVGLS